MLLAFTLYQKSGRVDAGDLKIDADSISAIVEGYLKEKPEVLLADLYITSSFSFTVLDPHRDVARRIHEARGDWSPLTDPDQDRE